MPYELLDEERIIAHQDRHIRMLYEILGITKQIIEKYGLNTTNEIQNNLLKIIEDRFELNNYRKYFIEVLGGQNDKN